MNNPKDSIENTIKTNMVALIAKYGVAPILFLWLYHDSQLDQQRWEKITQDHQIRWEVMAQNQKEQWHEALETIKKCCERNAQ